MPSDILSVRVTTEVVAEKEGEEPTLAVTVIVDKSVPVLGWVLMVSALFGLAAMVSGKRGVGNREWGRMKKRGLGWVGAHGVRAVRPRGDGER